MHTWSDGNPLRLQQLPADKSDPDPKVIACYGLWLRDRGQMMLRFVEERPVSDVTCAFLESVCHILAASGKRLLVLVWDNATWHTSQKVRQWMRAHNTKYTSPGKGYGNQATLAGVGLDSHFAITLATDWVVQLKGWA